MAQEAGHHAAVLRRPPEVLTSTQLQRERKWQQRRQRGQPQCRRAATGVMRLSALVRVEHARVY